MATSCDNCGICNFRHISKLSVVWCSDCDEGLCQECREHHSLSKASRNHNVVPIAKYQALPSFIANIKLHCDDHDEKYLLFCKEHNECVCRKCVISKRHGECKEIFPIEDVVQNAKTSVAFNEILSSFQELNENLRLILEDRQKNISSLSASENKLKSEISAVRLQINCHLDKIQDNFIAELHRVVENSSHQIQSFIASAEKNQTEIRECIEDIETIKEHATDMQTFLGIKQLEIKLNKTESDLQSWINSNSLADTLVSYQLNTLLGNISTETTTFGKLVEQIQPSKLSLQRRKEGQAQLKVNIQPQMSVERLTLALKAKIKTSATFVSGCCILPCGNLVVSNFNPPFLKIFKPNGTVKNTITIKHAIVDVACVNNETVAIISNTKKNIELVSLESGVPFRIVHTNFPSSGITYNKGSFIISSELQLLEVILEDSKTNNIGICAPSTHVASSGNTIYHINKDTHTIVCQNIKGNILWTFTNEMVMKGPRGIAVDEHGNIYVAGCESKNIIAISSDGKEHKILLSIADLCGSPWAVCYSSKLKSLLVANDENGRAFLYTVNYK